MSELPGFDQGWAAVVAAVVAASVALIVMRVGSRQHSAELSLSTLEFMTGGTQKRNAGISAIEAIWASSSEHSLMHRRLLLGTAHYLLFESEAGSSVHEQFNLDRVIALLMKANLDDPGSRSDVLLLRELLRRKLQLTGSVNDAGLSVPRERLEDWLNMLPQWM